jgi:hypothetical protein
LRSEAASMEDLMAEVAEHRVGHSSLEARCADPMCPADESEMIHALLTGQCAGFVEAPRKRRA